MLEVFRVYGCTDVLSGTKESKLLFVLLFLLPFLFRLLAKADEGICSNDKAGWMKQAPLGLAPHRRRPQSSTKIIE